MAWAAADSISINTINQKLYDIGQVIQWKGRSYFALCNVCMFTGLLVYFKLDTRLLAFSARKKARKERVVL